MQINSTLSGGSGTVLLSSSAPAALTAVTSGRFAHSALLLSNTQLENSTSCPRAVSSLSLSLLSRDIHMLLTSKTGDVRRDEGGGDGRR